MSTSAPDERSMSNPLCDSSLGSVVTSDYVTPLALSAAMFFLNGSIHEMTHEYEFRQFPDDESESDQ